MQKGEKEIEIIENLINEENIGRVNNKDRN